MSDAVQKPVTGQEAGGGFKFGVVENGTSGSQPIGKINPIFGSLYVLVEWSPAGKTCYDVISALDIMNSNNLNSGSMIFVRKQQRVIPANIVVISDDRAFLELELRKINGGRLQENQAKPAAAVMEQIRKRRRTMASESSEVSNFESNSNSSWQHFEQQASMQPPAQILTTTDRVLTARSPVTGSKSIVAVAPPMTFDQQTQTEARADSGPYSNQDLLAGQQTILAEQRLLRSELTAIAQKLEKFISGFEFSDATHTNAPTARDIVVSSATAVDSSFTIINDKANESSVLHEDYNTTTDSRFSFNDTNFSTTSSEQEGPTAPMSSTNGTSVFKQVKPRNLSRRSSSISLSISPTMNEMNWNGADSQTSTTHYTICEPPPPPPRPQTTMSHPSAINGHMTLGSNHTQIPAELYNSIDWSNYKAATRKLLVGLFDRNVLANHSLTGKPSPAFVGRGKPMKNRLDPSKIADIIEVVMRNTGVQENLVRTAITTKCADENKMARQRFQRNKVLQENSTDNSNEAPPQNSSILSYHLTLPSDQPPKIINGNIGLGENGGVKLDNKENIILQKN